MYVTRYYIGLEKLPAPPRPRSLIPESLFLSLLLTLSLSLSLSLSIRLFCYHRGFSFAISLTAALKNREDRRE